MARIPSSLEIHPPTISYHEAPDLDCPFPAHPNYDLKAWKHLVDNLELYKDPLLFWNVGA